MQIDLYEQFDRYLERKYGSMYFPWGSEYTAGEVLKTMDIRTYERLYSEFVNNYYSEGYALNYDGGTYE